MAANMTDWFRENFSRFFSSGSSPSNSTASDTNNKSLKIRAIGDEQVGKTCVLFRFIKDRYTDERIPDLQDLNVGNVKEIHLEQFSVKLKIYDQPKFLPFIVNAQQSGEREKAAMIVFFDVTNSASFEFACNYIKDFPYDITYIVAATKCDIQEHCWEVSKETISHQFGERVVYTSAKTNTGINKLFTAVASAALGEPVQKASFTSPQK